MDEAEVYVLLERIDERQITFFRMQYLSGFVESSTCYQYPFGRRETVFETDDPEGMMKFMLTGDKGYFRFYFRNPNPHGIQTGMIFFNSDNTLVLGVRIEERDTDVYVERLMKDFDSDLIMITYHVPPPDNAEEFKRDIGGERSRNYSSELRERLLRRFFTK